MHNSDALILGGGHNGLVCAAYLATAGMTVTLLVRRAVLGGAAVTEGFHPGFRNSTASYTPIASPVRNRTARLGPDRRAGGCRITPLGRCATPSRDRSEVFGANPAFDHGLQLIDEG